MRNTVRLMGFLLAAFGLSALGFGQGGTGLARLTGIVTDSNGRPIPGATVALRFLKSPVNTQWWKEQWKDESAVFEAKTDKKGNWTYNQLAQGIWEIRASKDGYTAASRQVRVRQLSPNPHIELKLEKLAFGSYSKAPDLLDQANALYAQNKFAEALQFYRKYLEADPEAVMVMLSVGDCLRESGRLDEALAEFQAVVAKTSTDPLDKELNAMALAGMGESYFKKGDRENAVKAWKLSVEKSPSSEVVAADLGEILFSEGKVEEAIRYYEIAVRLAPKNALFHSKLGFIYLNRGDNAKARACFSRVFELEPTSELGRQAAQILASLRTK